MQIKCVLNCCENVLTKQSSILLRQLNEGQELNKTRQYFYYIDHNGMIAIHITILQFITICCDDLPIVFTHIINDNDNYLLSYGYADKLLTVPFEPKTLYMRPECVDSIEETGGRVYHKAMDRVGGVGLVRSKLAYQLSKHFAFKDNTKTIPTHFEWMGQTYELTNELQSKLL
ncbi:unnamed protein product [Medioppia subpectinata]|uniref:Uncharacterized protein n=1 Tax=Medioppia subpectinata TaxID=1979941 RepID=A0A7R9KMB9_9ACAR|nr:unnamed protein product [Medioppia subpectinata]CAG2106165.1 unnamed protein product [Medioppia subpectinata]